MGDEANHAMKPASPEQTVFAEALERAMPEARAAYHADKVNSPTEPSDAVASRVGVAAEAAGH